jgi:hypothetical protein
MIILNYSHPLGPVAKQQLTERIGPFDEVVVPCQIDMDQPIQPQLEALVDTGLDILVEDRDFLIIPPALSFAAAHVAARLKEELVSLANREALPMIILKAEGTPRQYVLAEIL